jgi:hypothetical protein
MKSKILSIGGFLLLALLDSAWAGDIRGNWIASYVAIPEETNSPFDLWKRMGETVFSFKVDGAKLTGTVSDPQGETAIREGKIDGDEISFVVMRSFGGNKVKLSYEGKVDLNEIKFTLEAQGARWQRQIFVARREFQRNNGFLPFRSRVPVSPPWDPGEQKIRIPE